MPVYFHYSHPFTKPIFTKQPCDSYQLDFNVKAYSFIPVFSGDLAHVCLSTVIIISIIVLHLQFYLSVQQPFSWETKRSHFVLCKKQIQCLSLSDIFSMHCMSHLWICLFCFSDNGSWQYCMQKVLQAENITAVYYPPLMQFYIVPYFVKPFHWLLNTFLLCNPLSTIALQVTPKYNLWAVEYLFEGISPSALVV